MLVDLAFIMGTIWSFAYKITVNDDHFIYRNIFGKSKTPIPMMKSQASSG
jgi:hypothetical protein